MQLDSQGRYTVLLGAASPAGLPLDLFTTGAGRWLGVQPALPRAGEQPRMLLVGVPYVFKAADAETLGGKPASAYLVIRTSKPRVEVSWQVTGIRHDAYADAHRIPVEEEKPLQEQGMYLYLELFGAPPEKAVGYSVPAPASSSVATAATIAGGKDQQAAAVGREGKRASSASPLTSCQHHGRWYSAGEPGGQIHGCLQDSSVAALR